MPRLFATDRKYYRDSGITVSNDVRIQKGIKIPIADVSSFEFSSINVVNSYSTYFNISLLFFDYPLQN